MRIRKGWAIVLAALVVLGAVFFKVIEAKDRWIWRWIEARSAEIWPGLKLSSRVHSFGLAGVVLSGLEAAWHSRGNPSFVLSGGSLRMGLHETVFSARRFEYADIALEGVRASASYDVRKDSGRVIALLERLKKGEAEVTAAAARGRVEADRVFLDDFSCLLFGGRLTARGEGTKEPRGISAFRLVLHLREVDADKALKAFAPQAKFDLTGAYSGDAVLVFRGGRLDKVEGLLSSSSGGRMTVTDASVFQGVNATLGANLVVENLKDYYYDMGDIVLGLEEGSIKLDIDLNGAAGRRRLTVVFHGEEDGQP